MVDDTCKRCSILKNWKSGSESIEFADLVYASYTRPFRVEERFRTYKPNAKGCRLSVVEYGGRKFAIFARTSPRFTEIATGSLFEVISQSTHRKAQGLLKRRGFS